MLVLTLLSQSEVFPFETYVIKDLSYDVILGRIFSRNIFLKLIFRRALLILFQVIINLYLTTICFKANTCLRGRVYV